MIVVWTPNNDQPLWVQTGTPTTWTIPQLPIGDGWKPMKEPILVVNIQLFWAMTWCSESTSFLTHSYIQIYKKKNNASIGIPMNLVAANDIPIGFCWLSSISCRHILSFSQKATHGLPEKRCRSMGLSAPSVEEHYGEHLGPLGAIGFLPKRAQWVGEPMAMGVFWTWILVEACAVAACRLPFLAPFQVLRCWMQHRSNV